MKTIIEEVNGIIGNYETGYIELTPGLTFSQYQTLKTIDFYSNSRYLKGNTDSKGRDKPFYNIVNSVVDTSVVATDIDTKDIQLVADDKNNYIKAFLLSKDIYNWMKESDFGCFLNEMGETRARYGGVLVKKCIEKDEDSKEEELKIEVVSWKNAYVDPVYIEDGVIIEKHYLLPTDLYDKKGVWDDNAINEIVKQYAKNKNYIASSTRVTVLEVHGTFPETYDPKIGDKGDETLFKKMVFYIGGDAKSKQVILYSEDEKESPYKYLAWKPIVGRSLGRGVVEEGIEAQVWTNDAMIKEREAMELGSKVVFKTTSKKIANNITGVDNGHVIELDANEDFSQVNTLSNAIPEYRNLQDRWWSQYERATSAYDAQRGETPPSGQPYRLQALVQQQSSGMFDYRREEAGLFITEIFEDWVLPFCIKRFNKEHILAFEFSSDELKMIDKSFATFNANQLAKETMLSGKLVTPEMYDAYFNSTLEQVKTTKAQRFIEIPKDYFKNIKVQVSIITTGENKNKQAIMESLNNLMMTPSAQQYPELTKEIFGKLMEMSGAGISPAMITSQEAQIPPAQPTPAQPTQMQTNLPVGA